MTYDRSIRANRSNRLNGAPFDRSTLLTALRLSKENLTAQRKIEGERLNSLNGLNCKLIGAK